MINVLKFSSKSVLLLDEAQKRRLQVYKRFAETIFVDDFSNIRSVVDLPGVGSPWQVHACSVVACQIGGDPTNEDNYFLGSAEENVSQGPNSGFSFLSPTDNSGMRIKQTNQLWLQYVLYCRSTPPISAFEKYLQVQVLVCLYTSNYGR